MIHHSPKCNGSFFALFRHLFLKVHLKLHQSSAMSARGPVGASNRSDLFTSRTTDNKVHQSDERDIRAEESRRLQEEYGTSNPEDDPLQLEHMLGYAGDFRKTVLAAPFDENLYIKSLGSLVSIENLSDPHSQRFLRGHDMPVCCLAISNSGSLIASGQLGTKNFKGNAAPIFLWQTNTCQRLFVLRGLSVRVTQVAFSTDERFLCGSDEDGLLYVWDLATAEVVFGQKIAGPTTVLKWAEHKKVNHNTAYELVVGIGGVLNQGLFTYDSQRMQWSLKFKPYQMPPNGGLIRTFNCLDLSADRVFVYVGTSSGEMMVFRRDTQVFRSCIPVCTNGLQDLVTLPDDSVICGGGDGSFIKLRGRDMAWQTMIEARLDGMIKSLSLSCNRTEVLAACASGSIYRCLTDTLGYAPVSVSHTASVSCIAFSKIKSSDVVPYFATGTRSGEVRVWDLTDYASLSVIRFPKSGSVHCLCLIDNNNIISGWQDGSIRCTDAAGRQLWIIPTAHRDGTTTIAAHIDASLQYFVSGGADGAVRVWKYHNRELITQYTEHRKGVAKVIVDEKSPNIVHSVGGDCSVLSFDLKAARRIVCHIVNSGAMISMTQRKDSELELITCDSLGRLLYWDIDIRDPVLAVQDPSRTAIRACEVSPSGRFLAFTGDDTILKVLDVVSNQIISLGQSHSSPVLTLSWTPDERQIITGGDDSSVCIWNFYLGGGQ